MPPASRTEPPEQKRRSKRAQASSDADGIQPAWVQTSRARGKRTARIPLLILLRHGVRGGPPRLMRTNTYPSSPANEIPASRTTDRAAGELRWTMTNSRGASSLLAYTAISAARLLDSDRSRTALKVEAGPSGSERQSSSSDPLTTSAAGRSGRSCRKGHPCHIWHNRSHGTIGTTPRVLRLSSLPQTHGRSAGPRVEPGEFNWSGLGSRAERSPADP
jgi:hypothetical protein